MGHGEIVKIFNQVVHTNIRTGSALFWYKNTIFKHPLVVLLGPFVQESVTFLAISSLIPLQAQMVM